jgi:hypothetical protein
MSSNLSTLIACQRGAVGASKPLCLSPKGLEKPRRGQGISQIRQMLQTKRSLNVRKLLADPFDDGVCY